jgi:hypothetical protein
MVIMVAYFIGITQLCQRTEVATKYTKKLEQSYSSLNREHKVQKCHINYHKILAQSLLSRVFSWDVVDVGFPTCFKNVQLEFVKSFCVKETFSSIGQ